MHDTIAKMLAKMDTRTLPAVALLLAALYLSVGLGVRDPWPPDEPRYVLVAQEMVDSGKWFLPTRGGELYPDKPPLFMWSEAVVYALSGSIRLAFLLPSLLAGLGTLWLVYACGRDLWDQRTGLIAATLLFCTFQFLKQTSGGQIDALLCLWTTLAATGFLRHYLRGPAPYWLCLAALSCGLGVITKGVGFLPLLFVPVAMLYRRIGRAPGAITPAMPGVWSAASVAAFLLPLLAWVVPLLILAQQDPAVAAYRDNILLHQTVDRYSTPRGHINPPWYYLLRVIPLNWMSLSPLVLFALPYWWRTARSEPRFWLPLAWVALVILFFSASPAKRDIYIYPALPIMTLALAPLFDQLVRRSAVQWVYYLLGSLMTLALLGALAVSMGWYTLKNPPQIPLAEFSPLFFWVVATALLSGSLFRRKRAFHWLSVILVATWLAYRLFATPLMNDLRSSKGLLRVVSARIGPDAELGIAGWHEQTLLQARLQRSAEPALFGQGSKVADHWQAAFDWLQSGPSRWLLLLDEDVPACVDKSRGDDLGVYHRSHWLLVSADAVMPPCGPAPQSGGKRS
jgi:4-amino-4-deoxy-L-arabinose transferase-like glycosyltransferase